MEKTGANLGRAGVFLLISGAEFLLLVMVGEATYAGYSVHSNAISDLGATTASTFWFYEPAVAAWGLFWLLGAYYYWRGRNRRGSMALNLLPALGILLVAAFPENVSIAMHSIGSVIAIFFGIIIALLSYRWVESPLRYVLLTLGVVALVGTLVEFGGYNSAFMQQTLGPGGWERVATYPMMLWEIAFGSYLLSQSS